MATQPLPDSRRSGASWLDQWQPEDETFWAKTGEKVAWKTLWVTTFCLLLAFATWFVVSAVLVRLTGIGFKLDKSQLFWLAAMPGLAAGTLRIIHTFLIPIFGTRHTVAVSTLLLALPCLGWAWAIQNPQTTSFTTLMFLAFLAGLGGGNFSSFMPSTSLFFPKKKLGTALGIQAGIGNFGVSVVQFLTPIVIGIAMVGGTQLFNDPKKNIHDKPLHLQNAFLIWVPFIVIGALWAWVSLHSVPVKATFREQTDIFKEKHTWIMTALYIMTFGSFSGFSSSFGLMIKELFGKFEGAPDPLKYAFYGPFIGALLRVLAGPLCDRLGGAKVTLVSGVGLTACAVLATRYTAPTSLEQFDGFLWSMLGLFFFSGIGNASTFKQMPMIFPPRQASGVIGWTSAVAAYGPFLFSVSIGAVLGATGSPTAFFWAAAGFYLFCLFLNWHFYARKGAEKPC